MDNSFTSAVSAETRHNQLQGRGYHINIMEPTRLQVKMMRVAIERVADNEFATQRDLGRARHLSCALEAMQDYRKAVKGAHRHGSMQGLARALYLYHSALFCALSEYTQLTQLVIY